MIERHFLLNRRAFLIGCSAAASPLLTPVSFAAAPSENRLVVIVLRGAMDGLDVVRPLGDPDYAALRPTILGDSADAPLDLGGFFALHPACAGLMPLWQAGELGFAHAVATPYRTHRSHFTGQDLLENGGASPDGALTPAGDGWLNRAVALLPGADAQRAVAVGRAPMRILQGEAPVSQWLPVEESALSAQGQALLARLHAADPDFARAFAGAAQLRAETSAATPPDPRSRGILGRYVADRLTGAARIASFSLSGWDTHQGQARIMQDRLGELTDTLLALRDGLGAVWGTTLVLAVTEFGRTARENGSGGTDHGTGGVLVMAGGALKGGRVSGRWPGLSDADLYRERDLLPTADVRAHAAWALHGLFGLPLSDIGTTVFPDLDTGTDPGLLR